MTASAAEVEAAQKATADHSLKACGRHVGEMHECVCGSRFATVSGWSGHQAQAVADAVVAAAQPRIAAEALRAEAERVLGPSDDLRDSATCWSIASDLRARAGEIEGRV